MEKTNLMSSNFSTNEAMDFISQKREEILNKIQNGETETTYQIGGASYTEKEWDELMEKVDKNLDKVKEEQEAFKEKKEEQKEDEEAVAKKLFEKMKYEGSYRTLL